MDNYFSRSMILTSSDLCQVLVEYEEIPYYHLDDKWFLVIFQRWHRPDVDSYSSKVSFMQYVDSLESHAACLLLEKLQSLRLKAAAASSTGE